MQDQYKKFFNFVGAWFPDMDFEDLTEKEIVDEYKKTILRDELESVIFEAEKIRDNIENYWKTISEESNVYFSSPQEALAWLNNIIMCLKS